MFIEPKLCSKYSTKLEDEGGKLPKIMLNNRIDPWRVSYPSQHFTVTLQLSWALGNNCHSHSHLT